MNTQPAAPTAPQKTSREMIINEWKEHVKNTLRGFFTFTLPSGMILHDWMLHEKGDSRWVSPPARSYKDTSGTERYMPYIEFTEPEIKNKFRDQVLAALDRYFAEVRE